MLEKTYSPADIERRAYERAEAAGLFRSAPNSDAQPYTIMMPPPNVTGSLHMGHALNHTLQDVLTRFRRMQGRDALWQPGTDHAGIATQMVVERMIEGEGGSRREMGRDAFLERVWDWKAQSGGQIVGQLRRLGASADWGRERFTLDEGLSKAVREAFVTLHDEGLIYRDKRLVNWDPKLKTAISDLEVEQRDVKGSLWRFRYPIDGDQTGLTITVATTRPETMLGDTAVAVHPDDERYKDLIGKHVRLPIVDRLIPIVADEHADPETGSGAVKITPAHDFNDNEVGRRHALPFINVMDDEARILDQAQIFTLMIDGAPAKPGGAAHAHFGRTPELTPIPAPFAGMDRFEARKAIVAWFEENELLDGIDDHKHVVPHGDRGGQPIEPWLTDQWYCDAATLAAPALKAVEDGDAVFVPKTWENTYFDWMRNIQPWCISRQLWWGHRIPAWHGPDGAVFVAHDEEAATQKARLHYGEDRPLERDPDVLDTWFSSALWPFSTLGWPDEGPYLDRYYPGDVLVTGFDIIFFWVARMMMMGLKFRGEVPFKTVYIHALVRDAKGQKMSKSKGNVMDPLELVDQYGADALRFTLSAMAAQGRDIKLSNDRVEGYRNFCTKLWNAARFCQMNGGRFDPAFDPAQAQDTLNRWIISETARTTAAVTDALEQFRFNEAAGAIYQFLWRTFCDWHLEFAKPVLSGEDGPAKTEAQLTIGWALDKVLRLMHPIAPFITEELFEKLDIAQNGALLAGSAWPEPMDALIDQDAIDEMEWVTRLVSQVRAVRAEMNVPPAAKAPLLVAGASDRTKARLERRRDAILRLARLSEARAEAGREGPAGALQIVIDEAVAFLPIADLIDVDAERKRLEKEREKALGELERTEKRLANEDFIAKAPEDVVTELRDRRTAQAEQFDRLGEAIERLAAL